MNPNRRIHKNLEGGTHQDWRSDKKPSLRLKQSGSEMNNAELAALCEGEIRKFRLGKPGSEKYSLELLHRAIMQGDKEAWECVKQCFSELVSGWLRLHPKRKVVCELAIEEHYVAKTFERFWKTAALEQQIEFNSLARVLHFLQACLNGVILDSQRRYLRSKAIPLLDPVQAEELRSEDNFENNDVWDTFTKVIPDENEQRLAFLLFHCGLQLGQVTDIHPHEYSDVHTLYHMRSSMINSVVQNADRFNGRLD